MRTKFREQGKVRSSLHLVKKLCSILEKNKRLSQDAAWIEFKRDRLCETDIHITFFNEKATDCRTLIIYETSTDNQATQVMEMAEKYLTGKISYEELEHLIDNNRYEKT